MKNRTLLYRYFVACLGSCISLCTTDSHLSSQVSAQEPAKQSASDANAAYVPAFAMMLVQVRPQAWTGYPEFSSPQQKLMPLEVIKAWGAQNLGMHPLAISEIKIIAGVPAGMGPPPFGIVITTLEDFDPTKLSPEIAAETGPISVGNQKLYPLNIDGIPSEYFIASAGPRTALIGDQAMLGAMLNAPKGAGPIAELVRQNPPGKADIQALVAVKPLRPALAQLPDQLPPDTPASVRELASGAPLVDAARLQAKLGDSLLRLRLEILAEDQAGASELLKRINSAVALSKQDYLKTVEQNLQEMEPGPIADAWQAYHNRLPDELVAMARPKQVKDRVLIETSLSPTLIAPGVGIGLLLPAVHSARTAARRMQSSNNLKQLSLAMHNYNDTFRGFPTASIQSDDGKPLLSWRVALLPFLEQTALYNEFKLDEPWDSPHNIALLPHMPAVFEDPNLTTPEMREQGLTSYHIPVGERYMFNNSEKIRFEQLKDGSSNTILLLSGNETSLRPWTSPDFLPIEGVTSRLDFFRMFRNGREEITVSLGDGSVRTMDSAEITDELFEAMLTRDGSEVINLP